MMVSVSTSAGLAPVRLCQHRFTVEDMSAIHVWLSKLYLWLSTSYSWLIVDCLVLLEQDLVFTFRLSGMDP